LFLVGIKRFVVIVFKKGKCVKAIVNVEGILVITCCCTVCMLFPCSTFHSVDTSASCRVLLQHFRLVLVTLLVLGQNYDVNCRKVDNVCRHVWHFLLCCLNYITYKA